MSGTYGWNIENVEGFIENEGVEYLKMPMPYADKEEEEDSDDDNEDVEEEEAPESENPNPCIKGCCRCCCCVDDEPEVIGTNEVQASRTLTLHEKGYYWCVNTGEIPAQAVKVGLDKDGGDIYVGRAIHEGELQPAKIIPNHGCAYIAHSGEEIRKDDYEILCRGQCTVIWQECQEGVVPSNAVTGGCTADNEKLFIGRVFHDGTHTPGKIQPSLGACYIPYGGEELCFPSYEVLILQ